MPDGRDAVDLPVATSLIGSTGQVALLCAPAIGAALLTVMTPAYALGFDSASYLISALLLLSIRRPFARPQPQQDRLRIRADIAEGLRFLWHQRVIRTLTFSVFCVCLSWGGAFALIVVYANRALHLTRVDVRLGLLYTAGELGGHARSLRSRWRPRPRRPERLNAPSACRVRSVLPAGFSRSW